MSSIQEEFKKRKRNQIAVILVTIIVDIFMLAIIFMEVSGSIESMSIATIVTVAIVVCVITTGVAIFTLINWRCPNCNKYLGRSISHKVCKSCGEKLV